MTEFPIGSIESRAMARMRAEHIRGTRKRIEIISNVPRPQHSLPPSANNSTPYAEPWQETQDGVLLCVIYRPGDGKSSPSKLRRFAQAAGHPSARPNTNAVTGFGSKQTAWKDISEIGRKLDLTNRGIWTCPTFHRSDQRANSKLGFAYYHEREHGTLKAIFRNPRSIFLVSFLIEVLLKSGDARILSQNWTIELQPEFTSGLELKTEGRANEHRGLKTLSRRNAPLRIDPENANVQIGS
jgi:hypothetical protein